MRPMPGKAVSTLALAPAARYDGYLDSIQSAISSPSLLLQPARAWLSPCLPPVAPVVGWRSTTRLARDHYLRLDGNDYSVHPSVIGVFGFSVQSADRGRRVCAGRSDRVDPDRIRRRDLARSERATGAAPRPRRADRDLRRAGDRMAVRRAAAMLSL